MLRADTHTHTHNHTQTDANERLIHVTVVDMNKPMTL